MLTESLRQLASRSHSQDLIDVIIELPRSPIPTRSLPSNAPREESLRQLIDEFASLSAPVRQTIERVGGEVLGQAWINNTLKVRVPASSLTELDQTEHVTLLDTPDQITRETVTR